MFKKELRKYEKELFIKYLVIGLISLSLYSTYAMFTVTVETDEVINLSAGTIPVESEIIEYERITINAYEAKSIMLNIKNDTEANLYYGVWYEMLSPSEINENIEVAKLTSSEESTQGLINTNAEKKVKIVIKNTGSSNITLNIGAAYSKTSSLNLPTNRYVITNELPGKYVVNTIVTNGSTDEPSKIVDVGNSTNISVIPNTGYKYKNVSCTNAETSYNTDNNTLTLTNITDDVSCTVTNEIITYTVGVQASTGGAVSGSSSKIVNYNERTMFVVNPNTGYEYSDVTCPSGITGSYSTSNNTLTVSNVRANGTCTVNFKLKTYTVTVNATNGTSSPTSRSVSHGSSTTFTVTPNSGYEYESISCPGGSYNVDTKVLTVSNVTSSRTCTITFKKSGVLASEYIESLSPSNPETMNNDDPDSNVRYMGANPNNYVKFNNELWRIIGVFDVKSSEGGQLEKRLKIIRNQSLSSMTWDSGNVNDWSKASLQTYLNGEYYNSLDPTSQSLIGDTYWNLGGSSTYSDLTASMFYERERGTTVYSGRPTYWIGKIGLMYPSDYGYATSGDAPTNRVSCLAKELYGWDISSYSGCKNNDYLYNSSIYQWILTPGSSFSSSVFGVYTSGGVSNGAGNSIVSASPVLYLASTVEITGGNGTSSSPYTLG